MGSYVFDIETDGLSDVTRIWTIGLLELGTSSVQVFSLDRVPDALARLAEAETIVGHNIIGYDLPVIRQLYPRWQPPDYVLDTLVWARLAYPDLKETDFGRFQKGMIPGAFIGSHSLEAWGYRLGELKGNYAKQEGAFTKWSRELEQYCAQDVRVTHRLYERLLQSDVSIEALHLEHNVARIVQRQIERGFRFNVAAAEELYKRLISEREQIRQELQAIIPPWWIPKGEFVPKSQTHGYYPGAPCTRIQLVEFNPGSSQHIARFFKQKYNWRPEEFTEKTGEPKIDETVLTKLEYPEAQLILRYMTVQKRLGQLAEGNQAWLKLVNAETGAIHGGVNTCGAVTGRMTHHEPNLAQVPAEHEYRALFEARPGYVLVGIDADGLEARCLAHYLTPYDNGAFAKSVLEGRKEDGTDIHSINAKALGVDRDSAKTWFYAWMYGAGLGKLAKILRCSEKQAKVKYEEFLRKLPAFGRLKDDIDRTVKSRGFLLGLDKRRLKIRSPHAALNTLLQSAGAVVMKKALVIFDTMLQEEGLKPGIDYEFVVNVHDEWQLEAVPEVAEHVGKLGCKAIELAGKHFGFRCPLSGTARTGKSWAETH